MAHIKTFEEFNKPPVIDEARTVNNVSVANPQNKEELKRWNVVIRSGEAGTISAADSLTEILHQLAQDADFKKWFNSDTPQYENGLTFPNHNLLAIIYLGVQNKTNLIGQTVFKAQVAFLKYATAQIDGSGGFWVGYDVTKTKSRAKVKVDGVDVELAAWDESDLFKLRVTNDNKRIQALDKNTGNPIPENKVTPAYVEEHGATDGVKPRPVMVAALTTPDVLAAVPVPPTPVAPVAADTIKKVKDESPVLKHANTGATNKQTGGGGGVQTKKGKLKF